MSRADCLVRLHAEHGDIVYAETYDLRKVESYYEGNSAAPEQWSSVMLMVPLSEADGTSAAHWAEREIAD